MILLLLACDADGDGWSWPEDCDDASPLVRPGAREYCGGGDENCDGRGDEGAVGLYYQDLDGDGQGASQQPFSAEQCTPPAGLVADARDCDDSNDAVFDGATEVCNGADDDCDGLTDDADPGITTDDQDPWYPDQDGDGYAGGDLVYRCSPLPGDSALLSDCDDADNRVYPGAYQQCGDGKINDCLMPEPECGYTYPASIDSAVGAWRPADRSAWYSAIVFDNADAGDTVVAAGETVAGWSLFAMTDPSVRGERFFEPAWLSRATDSGLGRALATADLDGEGLRQLWVSAPGEDVLYGFAAVNAEPFTTRAGPSGWGVGKALAEVPDTDGDGLPELWATDVGDDGAALVWLTANDAEIEVVASSVDWGPSFGQYLAAAGDFDGDGLEDVSVTVDAIDRVAVWCAEGPTYLTVTAPGPMVSLPDSDNDGTDQLIVAGSPWVYRLEGDLSEPLLEHLTPFTAAARLPDIDGDSIPELGFTGAASGPDSIAFVAYSAYPALLGDELRVEFVGEAGAFQLWYGADPAAPPSLFVSSQSSARQDAIYQFEYLAQ